jgi:hypothetical protein
MFEIWVPVALLVGISIIFYYVRRRYFMMAKKPENMYALDKLEREKDPGIDPSLYNDYDYRAGDRHELSILDTDDTVRITVRSEKPEDTVECSGDYYGVTGDVQLSATETETMSVNGRSYLDVQSDDDSSVFGIVVDDDNTTVTAAAAWYRRGERGNNSDSEGENTYRT